MKVKLNRLGRTKEIEDFVIRMHIDESFDYDAEFIFMGRLAGKLVYLNAYRLGRFRDEVTPRFIHILMDKSIRRSKVAVDFIRQSEQYLSLLGYTRVYAYIQKKERMMSILAIKFGYHPDGETTDSRYYHKQIGGQNVQ